MLTVTLGHELGVDLEVERRVLTLAYRRLFEGRQGQALKSALCIEHSVRALDVMWGEINGWHAHLHAVLFMNGEPEGDVLNVLARRWRESVAWAIEERRTAGDDVRGIKLPGCDRKGRERGVLLEELNCETYLSKLGLELVSMATKRGKLGRSFNPWAIAARAAAGKLKFQRLWVEFTECMHGARQLFWSRGARKVFGLGEERRDEDLVSSENEAPAETLDDVITIEGKGVWDSGVRRRGWHEGLERALNSQEPVKATLAYLGRDALITRTGPHSWVASAVQRMRPGDEYGARAAIAARRREGPRNTP
jgi:hypothetical protein